MAARVRPFTVIHIDKVMGHTELQENRLIFVKGNVGFPVSDNVDLQLKAYK